MTEQDIYTWHKNPDFKKRKVPEEIHKDRQNGLFYNVDVLIPWDGDQYKMYEDSPVILSFMGNEPIAYWRRSIASYQLSLPFEEEKK